MDFVQLAEPGKPTSGARACVLFDVIFLMMPSVHETCLLLPEKLVQLVVVGL